MQTFVNAIEDEETQRVLRLANKVRAMTEEEKHDNRLQQLIIKICLCAVIMQNTTVVEAIGGAPR